MPDDAIVREGGIWSLKRSITAAAITTSSSPPLLDRMQVDMTRGVANELISRDAGFRLDEAAAGSSEALRCG
jgi:hypothetical protein